MSDRSLHARLERMILAAQRPRQVRMCSGQAPGVCPLHKVPMAPQRDDKGTYFSHRLPSGRWCNGGTRRIERRAP